MGLTNINAVLPADVPSSVEFMTIWSNPPIRVGKNELHAMLSFWLPRLAAGADAWMVVQKNLGSDSLHRWLEAEFPEEFSFSRAATNKGYRVLRARRR
jgi:16S rRNA G1207 methylase RsmC